MEALFLYIGKLILCSGVMFLYYKLSLKDKTFHHYNRFYLLGSVVISIFLPLLKVEYFTIEVNENWYLLLNKFQSINPDKNINHGFSYYSLLLTALGLVAIFFVAKILFGIFKIVQLKKQFPQQEFEGIHFYETNLQEAPFSFFRNLFWKNSIEVQSQVGKQILKHEMVHIEQKHSLDKLFVELSTAVFWFNPFFYFIKKELYLIHEYLADNKAVKHHDTQTFAQMLLVSHFSGTSLPATSPFLSSNLKKRLQMLQKPKTKYSYTRRLFALPVLFTIGFAYLVNAENKEISEMNKEVESGLIKKDTISPKKSIIVELVENVSIKETEGINPAEIDALQAQKDTKQAEIDHKQAIKNAKVAEEIDKEAAKSTKYAALDAEKMRKEAEKIRMETSDLSKVPATEFSPTKLNSPWVLSERVKDPTEKNTEETKTPVTFRAKTVYKTFDNEGLRSQKMTLHEGANDFEVYVNGEKIDKKDFGTIDPKTIKKIKVIKNQEPNRIEIELK